MLPPSITIHGILRVQFTSLTVFFHNLSPSFLWSTKNLLAWHPKLHNPYISSPNHCLLFAAHAHTIATCCAIVPWLSSNPGNVYTIITMTSVHSIQLKAQLVHMRHAQMFRTSILSDHSSTNFINNWRAWNARTSRDSADQLVNRHSNK